MRKKQNKEKKRKETKEKNNKKQKLKKRDTGGGWGREANTNPKQVASLGRGAPHPPPPGFGEG